MKTTRYDVAEHLRSTEDMAAYLEASIEEAGGDAALIAKALGDIARAKGMTQVANLVHWWRHSKSVFPLGDHASVKRSCDTGAAVSHTGGDDGGQSGQRRSR